MFRGKSNLKKLQTYLNGVWLIHNICKKQTEEELSCLRWAPERRQRILTRD